MEYKLRRNDLVYPDEYFKIRGVLFDVYNTLGPNHKEKHYHKGIEVGLKKIGMAYKHEVPADLLVYNEKVGQYFLDFVIDDKIVLEVKRGRRFRKCDLDQILGYLEATGLKLGVLALFAPEEVRTERIINWKVVNINPVHG